jgi:RNA polymerase sigma factor (sigma-70 family)
MKTINPTSGPAAGILQHVRRLAERQGADQLLDGQLLERFLAAHDQAAFAALVRRHGPMVLGLCRRILHREHDAEDVFQATFLILTHKAASIRKRASVGSWLHGVAQRLAVRAKVRAAERPLQHMRRPDMAPADPLAETNWQELRAILDEELQQLPEKLRDALVLAYLQGKTHEEAARQLGWSRATLRRRLGQGRELLRLRLVRRGLTLSAALYTSLVAENAGQAALSARLVQATARAATGLAAGKAGAAMVSAPVASLVDTGLKVLFPGKLKMATLVALAIGIVGGAAVAAQQVRVAKTVDHADAVAAALPARDEQPTDPALAAKTQPASVQDPTIESVGLHGRVLDPEGRPRKDAQLRLLGKDTGPVPLGTSGPDGRFTVQVPRNATQGQFRPHFLMARAPGAGLDFIRIDGREPARPLELRLVKDHVIRGRIIDTQGKPVAGARVAATRIDIFEANSVDLFLAAWMNRMFSFVEPGGDRILWQSGNLVAATTDANGRFALAGTGAERIVLLQVSEAGVAATELRVVNRQGFNPTHYNETTRLRRPIIVSGPDRDVPALYGPDATFVVEPGKIIRGVVREEGTGKPWPGVEVHYHPGPSAKTDAAGRYEFCGVDKRNSYGLWVNTDLAAGLLGAQVTVPDTNGYAAVTADIRVPRVTQTVVVTGRIMDSSTGKGVHGDVHLGILADNAFARAHPVLDHLPSVSTAEDGTFRIVTIPGPILLMGGVDYEWTPSGQLIPCSKYKPASPDARYPQYFPADHPGSYTTPSGFGVLQGNFCKVLKIKPGAREVKQDIVIEPASTITIKIQDAQGRPLSGTFLQEGGRLLDYPIRIETDSWLVGKSPKPSHLVFYERKQKLFGALTLKGDEKGPVTVRLRPCGAVRGRVVDKSGKPVPAINVNLTYNDGNFWGMHAFVHGADLVLTDSDGKFVIDQIIPGIDFQLWPHPAKRTQIWQGLVGHAHVESGRTKDLGNLRLIPAR